MQVFIALVFGVLFASSVFGSSPHSAAPAPAYVPVHDGSSCPCAESHSYSAPVQVTKPYAPSHVHYSSSKHAEEKANEDGEETMMRAASGYGTYGAPSYGGPAYGVAYEAPASAHSYGDAASAYGAHAITYVPAHPKKHHSGLVITCQPNLAGYAHGVSGSGYGSSGGHAASVYRSSSGYSKPYAYDTYKAPATYEYIDTYDSPTYTAPAYSAPAYKAPSYGAPAKTYAPVYSPPSYSAPAPVYSAPAPAYTAPSSGYSAPVPSYSAHASAYSKPIYPAPVSPYNAHAYAPAAPVYSAPSYHAPTYASSAPTAYAAHAAPSYAYRAADVVKDEIGENVDTQMMDKLPLKTAPVEDVSEQVEDKVSKVVNEKVVS